MPLSPAPPQEAISRRNFYTGAIYGMGAAIASALGLPALLYLFFPPKIPKFNPWVEIGDISSLAPNAPAEMTFRRNRVDGWKITSEKATAWVVKRTDNSVVAFGPQCTHLGCAYHWDDNRSQFLCPCHNSFFSIDGQVIQGPAPRPLDRYQTRLEGNKLLVGEITAPGPKA